MANRHGDFVWYELITPDADTAARFYGAVVGWTSRAAEAAAGYRILSAQGADVAGILSSAEGAACDGMRPTWLGYVGVDDVDASAAAIASTGGTILVPPTDMPGVGRFAFFQDPQGVPCYLMRGASDQASAAFSPDRPGHCQWNELTTHDQQAALAIYRERFGWQPGDAMDMGERGDYRFVVQQGKVIGAVMNRAPEDPPAGWTFYFGVPDIERAARAVTEHGGTICHGPVEVPGGSRIVVASDPHGAGFGLVAPP